MEGTGIVPNTIASRFQALQSRDFRLVFFTGSISNTGNWMEIVLRNWLVYQISGSAFILGLSNVVHWLPFLVLSPITGVYVDRCDKRWVIFYAQLTLTVVTILLGVLSLTGVITIWQIMALVLIHGISETFDNPARQSLVSELVRKDAVLNAVSLNSGVFYGTSFIGPALGGLLISASGVGIGFIISGLTFIPYMIALLFVRKTFCENGVKRANTRSDLLEGLRYLKQEKKALTVLVTVGVISVISFSYQTLLPVFAEDILKVGPNGLGFLSGAVGLGALLSSICLAYWSGSMRRTGLFICLMAGIYGISLLIFATSLSYGLSKKSLANEYPIALRSAFIPASNMVKAILEEKPYLPKAGIFVLTNPVISYPNSKATMKALKKLELIVVTELFHTPTTAIADYVLPASAGMEHEEIGYWPGWYGEVRAHPKLVDPPGEAWADTKIINELAKRLDLGEIFWEDDEEALDYWLGPSGLTYEDLKKKRTLLPKREYNKLNFATPSGKVEIYCKRLEELNLSPLPLWEELSALPELTKEFPLLVTNPKEDVYVNTGYKQIPVLRGMRPEPVVQLNPETAREAGIREGDQIYIETKNGRITQRLHLNPDLDHRVVNASFGWWFPEDPSNLYGWDRANINVLIGDDYPLDRAVGSALLRGIPCRIYKV